MSKPTSKKRSVRVVGLHDDDDAYDRAQWAAVPPSRRMEMVWELTLEYLAWRKPGAGEPRLQRSVCRVEQLRR